MVKYNTLSTVRIIKNKFYMLILQFMMGRFTMNQPNVIKEY